MKKTLKIIYSLILVTAVLLIASCSPQGKEQQHEDTEGQQHASEATEDHEHGVESEEGHHHDEDMSGSSSEETVWRPSGQGTEAISAAFHFIVGGMDDISPEVVVGPQGENVLVLTTNGNQVAFVFHQTYGNVGVAASLNRSNFKGTIKVVHHARNTDNYEFVAINGNKMKLGRVEEGKENIFDESDFSTENENWIAVRASAAGEHYKGYIGGESVTHGHEDEMKEGYVGIMTEGTGKIQIKSIEVSPLESE